MTTLARAVIATAVLVAATGGCTKYAYYGYQYRIQEESKGLEPEPAPAEARQLLATAKTVAFYPPDICLNTDTQISGDRKRVDQLRASCGVLLSSLERAAERAGYEVLSWQNLRGGKRPIDFAREGNVDVLFEINQFDLGPVGASDVERSLGFFERENNVDTPMNVLSTTADRCAVYAEQAGGSPDLGYP